LSSYDEIARIPPQVSDASLIKLYRHRQQLTRKVFAWCDGRSAILGHIAVMMNE